jgi:hypothetical protein
MATFL